MARYGKAFKDRAVARLLPPESTSVEEVSRQIGVSVSTLERWRSEALASGEAGGVWTAPARFQADLPPAQIVPRLADEGIYLASESSFHRVLRDAGQNAHRGRAKRPQPRHVGLPQRRAEQGKDRHDHDGRHRHAATMARDELAGAVRGFCSRAAFATFPALPVGLPGAPISRLLPCKRHCR